MKNEREVTIPLETIKQVFSDVFGSSNYFKIEIPESYEREIPTAVGGDTYSKYDRCTAGYESNSVFSVIMGQIFTVIDASVDEKEKANHMKSLIRQFFYPFLRDVNDDAFDMIDRALEKHNDKIK